MTSSVLVLGAGGFIGRRIVAALAASGVRVLAGVRQAGAGFPAGVESVTVDATAADSIAAAASSADAIVNSVAGDGATIVANAAALFTAAAGRRVVHLSTMSVYGQMHGVVDEAIDFEVLSRGDLDDYGRAKLAAEGRANASSAAVTLLRPGIVYGPGSREWSQLIGDLLLARRLGDLGAAGAGGCNLVHVDDVAAAVVASLATPASIGRVYNLGHPAPVPTWNDYFRAYAEALGAGPVAAITPGRLALELKAFGPLRKIGEIALGVGKVGPPIRPWLTRLCAQPISLSVRRAEQELGMRWTPLATGLAQTAAWHAGRRGGAAS